MTVNREPVRDDQKRKSWRSQRTHTIEAHSSSEEDSDDADEECNKSPVRTTWKSTWHRDLKVNITTRPAPPTRAAHTAAVVPVRRRRSSRSFNGLGGFRPVLPSVSSNEELDCLAFSDQLCKSPPTYLIRRQTFPLLGAAGSSSSLASLVDLQENCSKAPPPPTDALLGSFDSFLGGYVQAETLSLSHKGDFVSPELIAVASGSDGDDDNGGIFI
jgi:hypothetical protein